MAKNKKWSSGSKFEIVLQVLKGEATLNEICKRYDVAPSQVHAWKKQFLEQGSQVFGKSDKVATVTDLFNFCELSQHMHYCSSTNMHLHQYAT